MAASFAAHADEPETALELLAVQRKLQAACGNALHHRLICPQVVVGALIPDGHCPGPILPFWNRARECGIGERVVFDLDSQTLVRRIHRGAFRHRPTLEYAFHFQAEIVMQSARMVLVHHKNRSSSTTFFLRGTPGQWEGLDVPHIRRVDVPPAADGRAVYLPIETFGRVYMQGDDWHTDAVGYDAIAHAVARAIRTFPSSTRSK